MNLLSITLKPTLPWVCNGSDLNGFNALLVRYGWLDSFDVGRRSFGRVEAPQSDPGAVLSAPSAQTSCPRRSDTSNDGGNASNWKRNSVATFCSRKRSHVLRGLPSVPLSRRLRGGASSPRSGSGTLPPHRRENPDLVQGCRRCDVVECTPRESLEAPTPPPELRDSASTAAQQEFQRSGRFRGKAPAGA